eukprot:scaffold110386_cov50-Phaeocystis_antarctica.AAC.5
MVRVRVMVKVTALMMRKSEAAEMIAARHLEITPRATWVVTRAGLPRGGAGRGGARAHFFLSRSILGASCSW